MRKRNKMDLNFKKFFKTDVLEASQVDQSNIFMKMRYDINLPGGFLTKKLNRKVITYIHLIKKEDGWYIHSVAIEDPPYSQIVDQKLKPEEEKEMLELVSSVKQTPV